MRVGRIAVALALVGGCSTSSDHAQNRAGDDALGATSQAIQGGLADTTDTFAVGICIGVSANQCGQVGAICSGALITPNLVVTARHCVSEVAEPIDCSTNPTFGQTRATALVTTAQMMIGAMYRTASVVVEADDHVCGEDIALLVLDESVPSSEATPITPGVQHLMWDPTYYKPVFAGVGYGVTSAGGAFDTAGQRRIRQQISALCIPGDTVHPPCPPSEDPDSGKSIDPLSFISPNEFIAGKGLCSGDSGSSAYEQQSYDAKAPVSFGVLSRGPSDSCEAAVFTRLDAHRDFIITTATTASQNWTLYPEPAWTGPPTGAPPPVVDAGAEAAAPKNVAFGGACTSNAQCVTTVCADTNDGSGSKICSQVCSDSSSCPDGYSCQSDTCLVAPPEPVVDAGPPPTITIRHSCSASTSQSSGSKSSNHGFLVMAGAAIAACAVRRRKRTKER